MHPVGAGLPANTVLKPLTHSRVNPLLQWTVYGLIAQRWSAPWRRSALEFAQGSDDACRSGFTRECGVEATDAFAGEPAPTGGRCTTLLLSDGPHRGVDLRLSSRKGLMMPVGAGLPANAVLKPLTHSRVNPLLQGKVCGLIALQWSARWHPPWRRSALEFAQGSADALSAVQPVWSTG